MVRSRTSLESMSRTPAEVASGGAATHAVFSLDAVQQALRDLHYGTIVLVVHDSQVVAIERTERQRFDRTHSRSPDTGRRLASSTHPSPPDRRP
jgi:hypothetical protein